MMEEALWARASLNTSLGWTRLAFNVPIEIVDMPMILFLVLRRTSLKCSFVFSMMPFRMAFTRLSGLFMVTSAPVGLDVLAPAQLESRPDLGRLRRPDTPDLGKLLDRGIAHLSQVAEPSDEFLGYG